MPTNLPEQGAETRQLKVLDEELSAHQAIIRFEGQAQTRYDLPVRVNRPQTKLKGAEMRAGKLYLEFPNGSGYQTKTVTFSW